MPLFERRNAGKRTFRRKAGPVPIKFAAMDVRPLNHQSANAHESIQPIKRTDDAVSVFKELVERIPDMSFPGSTLLSAYALQQD